MTPLRMSPTIETWNLNPSDVGPLYPLAGWEERMFVACALFCIAFLVWKFATESTQYAAKAERLGRPGELSSALKGERKTEP